MYRLLGTHVAPVPYWDSLDGCTHMGAGCHRVVITDRWCLACPRRLDFEYSDSMYRLVPEVVIKNPEPDSNCARLLNFLLKHPTYYNSYTALSLNAQTDLLANRAASADLDTTSPDARPPRGLAPPATPHHPAARARTRRAADRGLRGKRRPGLRALLRRHRLIRGVGLLRELPGLRRRHREHGGGGARGGRVAELAGVRPQPAAQRRRQREHRHHRRRRRAPAPPADRAARDRRLLADLPPWGHRRRRRSQRGDRHHHVRQDARDRRLRRAAPVDLHPARLLEMGRERADHRGEPAGRPRSPVGVRRFPERPDPQALARRRERGSQRKLAGERHARSHPREARRSAQHRRPRRPLLDKRLLRRRAALSGPRRADRPFVRRCARSVQHTLLQPPRGNRPLQLLRQRLRDPLARRTGRRAGRPAAS